MSYTENTSVSDNTAQLDALLDFIADTPLAELESGFSVVPEGTYEVRLVTVDLAATQKGQSVQIRFLWEIRAAKTLKIELEPEVMDGLVGRKFRTTVNSKMISKAKDMLTDMARMWFGCTDEEYVALGQRTFIKLLMQPDENEVRIADVEVKHRKVKPLDGGDEMTFIELAGKCVCHLNEGAALTSFAGTASPADLV